MSRSCCRKPRPVATSAVIRTASNCDVEHDSLHRLVTGCTSRGGSGVVGSLAAEVGCGGLGIDPPCFPLHPAVDHGRHHVAENHGKSVDLNRRCRRAARNYTLLKSPSRVSTLPCVGRVVPGVACSTRRARGVSIRVAMPGHRSVVTDSE